MTPKEYAGAACFHDGVPLPMKFRALYWPGPGLSRDAGLSSLPVLRFMRGNFVDGAAQTKGVGDVRMDSLADRATAQLTCPSVAQLLPADTLPSIVSAGARVVVRLDVPLEHIGMQCCARHRFSWGVGLLASERFVAAATIWIFCEERRRARPPLGAARLWFGCG